MQVFLPAWSLRFLLLYHRGRDKYFWIIIFYKMRKQKIIIADGNKFFREGLKNVLANIGNNKVVAEVSNGYSLLNALENNRADIVFTDVDMPPIESSEVIRLAKVKFPTTRFIAFSSRENIRYVQKMVNAGADGYLFKSQDNYDLLEDIVYDTTNQIFLSTEAMSDQFLNTSSIAV